MCMGVCKLVHLAGSYQRLALPDDRYERDGKRDSGGKGKETQGLALSIGYTQTHTRPDEGQ